MEFLKKFKSASLKNNSLLCIGLDSNSAKIPGHLKKEIFKFNTAIIDATADLVCAYKPNTAFYEAEGAEGIEELKKTCNYLAKNYPLIPIILDAKRADIGSTNEGYVKFAFDYLRADAITINPYLGAEAIEPFLAEKQKGIIVLCRTSNPGSAELQELKVGSRKLYEIVAKKVLDEWNKHKNCLLVAGATYPDELKRLRRMMGEDFVFLVPGLGAQRGEVEKMVRAGVNKAGNGIIVNSSREIIFASGGKDFAEASRAKAMQTRDEINKYRRVK